MLEVLDSKVGGMGLPGKRIFGNKSPSFIEKRKFELEACLNRLARSQKPEFLKFVKQIKDNEFNVSLKQKFSIEWWSLNSIDLSIQLMKEFQIRQQTISGKFKKEALSPYLKNIKFLNHREGT